ncbi:MAG: hypothetical protein ACE14V_01670 [bacterium]
MKQNKIIIITILILILGIVFCSAQSRDTTISQTTTAVKRSTGITPPKRIEVPGQRFLLSTGQMYIPDFVKPRKDGKYNLVVFFHGAAWCSEQVFYPAHKNAILVSFSTKSYSETFSDTTRFQKLLDEVNLTLETAKVIAHPKLNILSVSSFSGGYSAVFEVLKVPEYYARISNLILADSLYAGFTDTTRTVLIDEQMAPFLKYAQDAAKGKKTFWFTHLYPPEEKYRDNTSTKTASYLIDHLKGKRKELHENNQLGMTLLYSCDIRKFHIRGYSGMTNQDHFNHFYNLAEYYKKLDL